MTPARLLVVLTLLASASSGATPPPDPRVESILGQMTLEEKIDLLGGVDGFFVRGLPRLNVPRLKMADGPVGVRNFGPATAMAAGIGLAATWNPELAERVGTELGRDARAKGVHFLLAPAVNIYRAPMNGRNFEYFGEDPLLAGRIAAAYIRGVQAQGVSATVKHFIANNSEYDRHHTDAVIDERALREIYLPAFEAAVKDAHVGAVMTAYNLVNGVHMSQHPYLNVDVLRKDWGFTGLLMSDWDSTYDAVGAANGGLDLEMPSGKLMNRDSLLPAVKEGRVAVAAIDEKVRRVLGVAARFGWLDRAQADPDVPRFNVAGRRVALEAAREAAVLLKNDRGRLPLDRARVHRVAVVGPNTHPAVPAGGGSARVEPFAAVSLLQGVVAALPEAVVDYHRGLPTAAEMMDAAAFRTRESGGDPGFVVELFDQPDFKAAPFTTRTIWRERSGDALQSPAAAACRWTGYFTPKSAGEHEIFLLAPGETSGYRMTLDGAVVLDAWDSMPALLASRRLALTAAPHKVVIEQEQRRHAGGFRFRVGVVPASGLVAAEAKAMAARADVVIVAAGFNQETEAEGADRTFALPVGQDELIREMAAANPNTIVVLTSGGGVDMRLWIDAVPAVLEGWFPGEEGGTALAEILVGDTNPSGRLPATFERAFEDNPVQASYYPIAGTRRVEYREGVFVGYRGYERDGKTPLFAFGHGLSYTTFEYGNVTVTPDRTPDGHVTVAFDVTNTGPRAGAEVAQVYVGERAPRLPRPARELKGFAKVRLEPGETQRVSVTLDARAFAYYDSGAREWRADAGLFEILVGPASDRIARRGAVRLAKRLRSAR